ncbi:hypothetical protein CLOBY_27520 [Clostridium saccharobutylicum]|uniref:hypothetical protein n=1 Tax=Clostridium saccharobutylicum TaxID=169679 RepID=UPI000983B912|nr:hypothetical protein [Clostridium saccharobutylicum]AQS10607.1 hypothetical protein CLOBY_27520 [Clostridium saccharobutylicum]MBC2438040.1 hypothetical protein [Clostridium saccharobutylicum]NSB90507.1 hypothetical protein [Clostridium saccharobutylicum]NYC31562.1 hypothetical protein [Clostridium saccharobutylicum]OOM18880.1 hypothetical protein CLSAB_03380 [Clostridium saccharobutylicum]
MNILKETHSRLEYQYSKLKDLQECLEQPVTKDCAKYLKDKIYSTSKNIEYYQGLINILEPIGKEDKQCQN